MFRSMRRKDRETSLANAIDILKSSNKGVLATISVDNGYPYVVTVNHIYINGYIYFHSANKGHKIDNINFNNKVSFTATAYSKIIPKNYSTKYKSSIVFGRAYTVKDDEEKKLVLTEIAKRFTGDFFSNAPTEIAKNINRTTIVRIEIEDIKGKSN